MKEEEEDSARKSDYEISKNALKSVEEEISELKSILEYKETGIQIQIE